MKVRVSGYHQFALALQSMILLFSIFFEFLNVAWLRFFIKKERDWNF